MTTRLILRIDEHWPAAPVAAWALLGADGKLQAEGESDPRHWPAADECTVLLAGAQCLWLETSLPRAARRDAPRLLAYALEDRLLSDPDSQHLSISHRRPAEGGETLGVLVVARERMRQLLAQLQAIGRLPRAFYSELQWVPGDDENWHVALGAGSAIIRSGTHAAHAVDGALLQPVLEQQLAAARSANRLPQQVVVHAAPGVAVPELAGLALVAAGKPYLWWQGANGAAACNLLHDEFAVAGRRSPLSPELRRPLLLAGLALAVWLLAGLGETLWRQHQLADLQARQARTFQTAFPNMPAIAPAAQMRQQLNLQRARHGLLRDDDALALLAVLGEALGSDATDNLSSLRFVDGRLDLGWRKLPPERLAPLQALLAARGLLLTTRNEGDEVHLLVQPEILP